MNPLNYITETNYSVAFNLIVKVLESIVIKKVRSKEMKKTDSVKVNI